MLAKPQKKLYTADEFLSMTDLEGRFELIDGEIYDMSPSPNVSHQRISISLCLKIGSYVKKGKCEVFHAPFDVKLNEHNVVQPDLLVVCDPDKLSDGKKCNGAPDWVIEILSPSNAAHDTATKFSLYMSSGVHEYWIVDPMNEKVFVYRFSESNKTGIFTFDDDITARIYSDAPEPLIIRINDL